MITRHSLSMPEGYLRVIETLQIKFVVNYCLCPNCNCYRLNIYVALVKAYFIVIKTKSKIIYDGVSLLFKS